MARVLNLLTGRDGRIWVSILEGKDNLSLLISASRADTLKLINQLAAADIGIAGSN